MASLGVFLDRAESEKFVIINSYVSNNASTVLVPMAQVNRGLWGTDQSGPPSGPSIVHAAGHRL